MYQIVDLAKHKILALSQIGLLWFFHPHPPPLTCINISLDFIFRFSGKSSQMQLTLLEAILSIYLSISLICHEIMRKKAKPAHGTVSQWSNYFLSSVNRAQCVLKLQFCLNCLIWKSMVVYWGNFLFLFLMSNNLQT